MSQDSFIAQMTPYAEQASQATGLDAQLILAQWGNETAWGTSEAWTQDFNPAGIGITGPGVSGENYGSPEGGVQAYINFLTQNSRYANLLANARAGASIQVQAQLLGESGWAEGQYNNGGGPGSDLLAEINADPNLQQVGSGGVSSTASAAPVDWAGLAAAGAQGGTAYLESLAAQSTNGQAATAGTTSTSATDDETITVPGSTDPGFDPNSQSKVLTGQQASAWDTITGDLTAYGFSTQDANAMMQWMVGEITSNVDPTQVAIDIQTPGTQGYTIFEKYYPGFVTANQQLNAQGLPALSVSQYSQYQTTAQQMAQAAGLPPGFINSQDIGILIGNNVSTTELSARLNSATTLAYQSTPEQQQMFNQYFGVQYDPNNPFGTGANAPSGHGPLTPGQIAAITLDPTKAEPLIQQQITAAQVGGAGVTAGVGAISQPEATNIAQANPNLTQAQIQSAVGAVAPEAPLESTLPGQEATAAVSTLTPDQLVGTQLLPTTGNLRQLQTAQESRKAPFAGGGGFVQNTKGAVGTGSASSNGAGQ